MSRLLLFALIGLSLCANAWLMFSAAASPASSGTAGVASSLSTSAPKSVATAATKNSATALAGSSNAEADPNAPRGLVWKRPVSADDFRQLADDLRAAGFPPRLIARVVRTLYEEHANANSRRAGLAYWQQFSTEAAKEDQEMRRGLRAKIDAVLGPDARPSLGLDPVSRQRRYGNLSDAKIDAIAAIERDYDDMQTDVYRSLDSAGFSTDAFRSQRDQTKLLYAEKLGDLAKILSPAELADYDLRNSETARNLARSLANIDVTPEQFAGLFAARRAYDEANQPISGVVSGELQQKRLTAQAAYFDQARAVLPPDRFYQLLTNSDVTYRAIAQLPGATQASAYEAWSLQREFSNAMLQLRGTVPSADQIRALYADFNARLDRALGAETAAAFRKTSSGRMFSPPQIRANTAPRN